MLLLAWVGMQGQEKDPTAELDAKLCPFDTVVVKCGKETFQIEISQYCGNSVENESMFQKFRVLHRGREVFRKINKDSWTFIDQHFDFLRYAKKYGVQFDQPYFWQIPGKKGTCSLVWFGYPYSTGTPHVLEIYRLDETGHVECLYNGGRDDRFIRTICEEGKSFVVEVVNNPCNVGFLFESSPWVKFWELRIDQGIPRERLLTEADRAERMQFLERQCRKLLREPVGEMRTIASHLPQGGWEKTADASEIRQVFLQMEDREFFKIGVRYEDEPLYPKGAADHWVVVVGDSIDFANGYRAYRVYDPSGEDREACFHNFLEEDLDTGLFTGATPDGRRYTATVVVMPAWYEPEE